MSSVSTELVDFDPFSGAVVERVLLSTEAQREVWLASELSEEASLAYNESVRLSLHGSLDVAALRSALDALVARHDALRSSFGPDGAEMIVMAPTTTDWPLQDLRGLAGTAREQAVQALLVAEVSTPFQLAEGPLFRAQIVQLADQDHLLVMTAHHIVCDGWSWGVIAADLGRLYDAARGLAPAPAPAATFDRYADWSQALEQDPTHRAALDYWLGRFAGAATPVLDLPLDRPRAAVRSHHSRRFDLTLDGPRVAALRRLAGRSGTSFHGLMFSLFATLLHRLSGQSDLVIGVPAAGQAASALHDVVGHCVNLLPVRVSVDPAAGFDAFAKATGSLLLDAFEHQTVTYGSLLKELPITRDPGRPALVAVMFNVDTAVEGRQSGFDGVVTGFESNPRRYENFELFVNATPQGDGYRLEWQYNCDLFDEASIARWARSLGALIDSALATPATAVGHQNLFDAVDRRALYAVQAATRPYPGQASLLAGLRRQVARRGAHPAVEGRGQVLSYAALEERSNQLAHALRARGVGRGVRVGLCLPRSTDLVVALIATLKAGGTYVPLDPAFPKARLDYYAEDAGLGLLITDSTVGNAPRGWRPDAAARVFELDRHTDWFKQPITPLEAGALDAGGEDAAYVIYTSGSTGQPKGVCVPHRSVSAFLDAMVEAPGLAETDRLAAVTTLSFDIAVLEIFLPLQVGATVVLVDKDTMMDGAALAALLVREGITTLQATPSLWRLLLDAGWRGRETGGPGLRALVGGEALGPTLARELLTRVDTLWNMYGPTETTVWSSVARIDAESLATQGVSIGRPITHSTIWVLDAQGEPCLPGVAGELHIGGAGVALGYLDRPVLTAERFVADPMVAGAAAAGRPDLSSRPDAGHPPRVYRTGDLGRWGSDGRLYHLGRIDFQVKLRGFRIELGEIEAACAACPWVADSVVMLREDQPGDPRLVAYLVARPGSRPDRELLLQQLRVRLPEYMLPSHFEICAGFPTLPNGKVDRRALPAPDQAPTLGAREVQAPRSQIEGEVLAAMERVLNLPGLGVTDNFFTLGGHSLLAARLVAQLNHGFGVRLNLRNLFEAPTAERLAEAIGRARAAAEPAAAVGRQAIVGDPLRREAPTTVMQERVLFVEAMLPGRSVYHEPSAHRLLGAFDRALFETALRRVVERQGALRTSFHPVPAGAGAGDGTAHVQRIAAQAAFELPFEDLAGVAADQREATLHARMQSVIESPMDLARAPLCHMRLYRLGEHEHVFLFVPHHLIWDGWSFDLLYDEMSAAYKGLLQGREEVLPPLPVSYADYAVWHQQWLKSPAFQTELAYWKQRLLAEPVPKPWPAGRTHRSLPGDLGGAIPLHVDPGRTARLHEFARAHEATMSMVTTALFGAMVQRLARGAPVSIGVPLRGREIREIEPVMGFFNNLVSVQWPVDEQRPMVDYVADVRAGMLEMFAHQEVPFERLIQESDLVPRFQQAGFYQVMFSFQDGRDRDRRWGPLFDEALQVFHRSSNVDFGVWLMESQRGLDGAVIFNSGLFDEASGRRLHGHYLAMIDRLLEEPAATVATIVGGLDVAELRGATDGVAPTVVARAEPAASVTVPATAPAVAPAAATAVTTPKPAATIPVAATGLTPTEQVLAGIWEGLLEIAPIERLDNFFDLGGSSLLAMQAVELIAARTGRRVPPGSFAFETLAQIAHAIDAAGPVAAIAPGASAQAAQGGHPGPAGADRARVPEAADSPAAAAAPGLLRKLGSLFRR